MKSIYFQSFLMVWLGFVAISDFMKRRVGNNFIIAGFLLFLISIFINNEDEFLYIILTGFLFLALFLIFYSVDLMGAGDVKFLFVFYLCLGSLLDYLNILFFGTILSLFFGFYLLFKKNIIAARKESNEKRVKDTPYAGCISIVAIFYIFKNFQFVSFVL